MGNELIKFNDLTLLESLGWGRFAAAASSISNCIALSGVKGRGPSGLTPRIGSSTNASWFGSSSGLWVFSEGVLEGADVGTDGGDRTDSVLGT